MCRFIFYLGTPIKISAIVTEPSHGLLQQSLHSNVTLNADGFGIAWWVDTTPIPGVFKDVTPAWSNVNLRQLSRVTMSSCIMSHVRAASCGSITSTNCHPFTQKNLSLMHNGTVSYFPKLKRQIFNLLSQTAFESIKGTTDSEVLFALFITNYEKEIGYVPKPKEESSHAVYSTQINCFFEQEEDPYPKVDGAHQAKVYAKVLRQTILQLHQLIQQYELDNGILTVEQDGAQSPPKDELLITKTCSKLNLVISDGENVVASRYVTGPKNCAHTLYWSRGQSLECDQGNCRLGAQTKCPLSASTSSLPYSVIISSEPLATDFKCEEVPVNNMVIASKDGLFEIQEI